MSKVLINCLEKNEGSRRTILANGGKYESTIYVPGENVKEIEMTSRELLIRKMTFADLDDLCALLSDSEVMRYIEPPFSKKQTAQFLMDAGLSENPLVYAVEDSSSFIGYVIFHDYDEDNMEIGWILKREVWGQGYASLLTKMLIDKSRKLGKGSIIECDPRQAVTKHIAKKHGFVFSGKRDGCDVYKLSNSH